MLIRAIVGLIFVMALTVIVATIGTLLTTDPNQIAADIGHFAGTIAKNFNDAQH